MKSINDWVTDVHSLAVEKGWYELYENGKEYSKNPLEIYALVHTEVSEAVEEARTRNPAFYTDGEKPKGELIEIADVILRLMDYCGHRGWDLEAAMQAKHNYNHHRPHRHDKTV